MVTEMPGTGTGTAPAATVGEVMRPPATTVEPRAHLAAAGYLMKHSGGNALVVTSADGHDRPLAIVTATDISRAVADGRNPEETRIENLWSSDPLTVEPGLSITEAARLMLAHRFHHLPVVDAGRLVGIVDMSDVCAVLLRRQGGNGS